MDITQLESWLTEGLTEDQKVIVKAALNRDTVKTKAATLREQSEFATLESQRQALQAELEGGGPGKPGTRAYAKWYADNFAAVEANSKAILAYDKKNGDGAFARMAAALESGAEPPTASGAPSNLTKDDILRVVQQQFQEFQAPNIGKVVKDAGRIVQRHMFAGRKNEIDFDAIDNMMLEAQKRGRVMTLEDAYNEWDKPEREKSAKAAEDARVEQRVQDELKKRGASSHFPGGADMTPSALHQRTKSEVDGFNKDAFRKSLVDTWNNPEGKVQ